MSENYNVITGEGGVPIKAWTKGVQLEDAARQQLLNCAQMPFIYRWLAAMPDVHWGRGSTRAKGIKPPSQDNGHRRVYVNSLRLKCLDILGRKCIRCGYEDDVRALQIDHVNSDGRLDRTSAHSGGSYYHHILNEIDAGRDNRYQVLCANCNVIMRDERQECPRKG